SRTWRRSRRLRNSRRVSPTSSSTAFRCCSTGSSRTPSPEECSESNACYSTQVGGARRLGLAVTKNRRKGDQEISLYLRKTKYLLFLLTSCFPWEQPQSRPGVASSNPRIDARPGMC